MVKSPPTTTSPVVVTFLKPVTSLFESTITAFDADIVPAVIPSTKFNSDAVDVTPSRIFNSAAVAVIAVPLKFIASKYATPSIYMSFHS